MLNVIEMSWSRISYITPLSESRLKTTRRRFALGLSAGADVWTCLCFSEPKPLGRGRTLGLYMIKVVEADAFFKEDYTHVFFFKITSLIWSSVASSEKIFCFKVTKHSRAEQPQNNNMRGFVNIQFSDRKWRWTSSRLCCTTTTLTTYSLTLACYCCCGNLFFFFLSIKQYFDPLNSVEYSQFCNLC